MTRKELRPTPGSISVIIPHYVDLPGANETLHHCVQSLRGYDELIVVVNEGYGYARSVNQGLRIATGEFLCVVNNDCTLLEGDLRALTDPFAVVTPYIVPRPRDDAPRAFWCMPRWVYDEVGGLDERFQMGYFEDDDFIRRLRQEGIPLKSSPIVSVMHKNGGGMTMKQVGEQKYFDINQKLFNEKWGIDD